ncbi:MAG: hypothetical protein LBF54_00145 [Holosporaceae bacterium]|nr:hypothetical protein [Holosporaceae bacterium]
MNFRDMMRCVSGACCAAVMIVCEVRGMGEDTSGLNKFCFSHGLRINGFSKRHTFFLRNRIPVNLVH